LAGRHNPAALALIDFTVSRPGPCKRGFLVINLRVSNGVLRFVFVCVCLPDRPPAQHSFALNTFDHFVGLAIASQVYLATLLLPPLDKSLSQGDDEENCKISSLSIIKYAGKQQKRWPMEQGLAHVSNWIVAVLANSVGL